MKREQVSLQVGNHLRDLAMRGELKPGDRLPPERELARRLCISRPSLREGISHLATFGVVKSVHGVGTFISTGLHFSSLSTCSNTNDSDHWQMFETRLILEPNIASLAAERASDAQIADLARAVAEMCASADDPEEYLVHDIHFHTTVALASGNRVLSALMDTVKASAYDTRHSNGGQPVDLKQSAEAHGKIYRAIRARNPIGARLAMEQHLSLARIAMSTNS